MKGRVRRRRSDSGTALVEFVWLAILLLIPLLYVVIAVFAAQQAAFAATTAARSASRAFVTAPDTGSAEARAYEAARLAFADQGMSGGFALRLTCRPEPGDCLTPGSAVVAQVRVRAALPLTPLVFGGQAPSIRVEASHRSPYGTFREARP